MRRGQVVPAPAPGQRLLERHVEQVVDRPVGVALLDVLGEPRAVELVAVHDPVGADHARVADVDHVRVDHVRGRSGTPPAAPARPRARQRHVRHQPPRPLARAEARHQHAHQQVEQHRVDERHRHADLAAVEEHVRGAEGEQHEQVEMQQPERPAQVHEGRRNSSAQREPHVGRVQLAPEGARVAARHRQATWSPVHCSRIAPERSSTCTCTTSPPSRKKLTCQRPTPPRVGRRLEPAVAARLAHLSARPAIRSTCCALRSKKRGGSVCDGGSSGRRRGRGRGDQQSSATRERATAPLSRARARSRSSTSCSR